MKMRLTATPLLLIFPFLLLIIGSCDSGNNQYSTISSDSTQQSNQQNAVTQQNSLAITLPTTNTPHNAVQQNPQVATPNVVTNTKENSVVQQSQSSATTYAAAYAAEAYYQKLLAKYGENYQECLERSVAPDEVASGDELSHKQLNVLVALDSSGSMIGKVRGKTKIALAKEAIASFANQLPKSTQVGLTVYGHKGSNQQVDKAVSCAGIETFYPISQLDNIRLSQAVDSFQPTGFTPLAATLDLLNQNFSTYDSATNQNVVYVVSDGIDNCDGDPVTAARQLHTSNAKVIVNVIGLNVNQAARRQLRAVAEAGGGTFFSVRSENELNQAFESVKNPTQLSTTDTLVSQNQASTIPLDPNRIIVCITIKMNRELAEIISQANRLAAIDGTNSQYSNYVLNRLKERQDKITAWRNQLQVELSNQGDGNLVKLKQQLATATQ